LRGIEELRAGGGVGIFRTHGEWKRRSAEHTYQLV
jgi:hypothetical protein